MTEQAETTQLRRYELNPGSGVDFVAWWAALVPKLRVEYGFTIEFALLNREIDEFTWAVSYPGDEAAFREAEGRYNDDPRRTEAFKTAPPLRTQHIAFVARAV